ncbi:MAG TPA: hypothetical protein VG734_25590 [Lacunisphaera sp.]|nr:hypothetical protein [Lacunisphaera sp.]
MTLENAADRLKDAIRAAFIELLPPDQWKAMVETELRRFMSSSRDTYSNNGKPSAFSELCEGVFREYVKAELKAMLATPEWQQQWSADGKQLLSDAVKDWLTRHQQELVISTVQALAGQAAQSVLSTLQFQR